MDSSSIRSGDVERAVTHWQELLERGDTAAQTHQALMEGVHARGLTYSGRPICTFLRPRFIDVATWVQCARAGAWFHATLSRLMCRLAADADALRDLGIRGDLAELVHACALPATPLSFLRFDGFMDSGILRLVEFNADSPGGAAFHDALGEVFSSLPIFQAFTRAVRVSRRSSLPLMRHAVEQAARAARQPHPRVAIVDWREVSTHNEFPIIAADLERAGIAAVVCDPRDMELHGDRLTFEGQPIDIVLKRVLVTDLVARASEVRGFVEALRRRCVVALNPLAVQAVTTKSLLALFWEGRLDRLLSARARAVWARHIPFTMRVHEGYAQRDGRRIDIPAWILHHRERLVLKPSDAWGADGVRLGWACSPSEWEAALAQALQQGDHVVQERVEIPQEEFPFLEAGVLRSAFLRTELSPYTFSPRAVGEVLTRLSGNDLLNVKSGGGSVVTYVVGSVEG